MGKFSSLSSPTDGRGGLRAVLGSPNDGSYDSLSRLLGLDGDDSAPGGGLNMARGCPPVDTMDARRGCMTVEEADAVLAIIAPPPTSCASDNALFRLVDRSKPR